MVKDKKKYKYITKLLIVAFLGNVLYQLYMYSDNPAMTLALSGLVYSIGHVFGAEMERSLKQSEREKFDIYKRAIQKSFDKTTEELAQRFEREKKEAFQHGKIQGMKESRNVTKEK
jgi:hypothetical protein